MNQHDATIAATISSVAVAPAARGLTQVFARYRAPSLTRSMIELAITFVPLVMVWALMWATLGIGYWLCLLLAIPAAGLLVRLFMIQHDCGQRRVLLQLSATH